MIVATFFIDVRRDPFQFYHSLIYTTLLRTVNSGVDPVVYYYRSNGFRKYIKILVRRLKIWHATSNIKMYYFKCNINQYVNINEEEKPP